MEVFGEILDKWGWAGAFGFSGWIPLVILWRHYIKREAENLKTIQEGTKVLTEFVMLMKDRRGEG